MCTLCSSDSDCAQIRTIWLASAHAVEEKEKQAEAITSITPDDKDELMRAARG